MRRLLTLVLLASLFLLPEAALAQEPADDDSDDVLIRIGRDVVVAEGESIGTVIVIDGNALVDGTVRDLLLVIEGDATINGEVVEELTVISGDIQLADGSTVNDVHSIAGDLNRAPGATVRGDIEERDDIGFLTVPALLFGFAVWIAMSIAVLVAGLVFAAVGGRQLNEAARVMSRETVNSILGAVFLWIGLPILAALALISIIGIPIGIGILLFLLPALWFLGYLTTGCWLGGLILRTANRDWGEHPYLAVLIGLVILQLIVLIPFVGGAVAAIAGLWGAGTLAFLAYRAAGGRGVSTQQASPA